MSSHEYTRPKVVPVKVTSPHRNTKLHTVVPKTDADKKPSEQVRPRRDV